MEGLGAGLAALGFWLFIAAVVTAGIWESIRKREAQHETLRRLMESGQPVDHAVIDKILGGDRKEISRDLTIGGLITLAAAPGLVLLGWFLSLLAEDALMPLLGVAALVGCIGVGLLIAARFARHSEDGDSSTLGRTSI
jgi:hypothetical protein